MRVPPRSLRSPEEGQEARLMWRYLWYRPSPACLVLCWTPTKLQIFQRPSGPAQCTGCSENLWVLEYVLLLSYIDTSSQVQHLVDAALDQRTVFECLKTKQGDGKVIITANFQDKMHKLRWDTRILSLRDCNQIGFRLPKIERQDKLWEFFESFFVDLKCDMFYQKERKIQIFLKNENYTAARKRRASSDSVDSESVRGSPVSPVNPSVHIVCYAHLLHVVCS